MEFDRDKSYGADLLRGLAIVSVLIFHAFGSVYGYICPWADSFRDFQSATGRLFLYLYPLSLGWSGVSLFFVISGFCIHLSHLRDPGVRFSKFFWRRLWRICPAYFISLMVFAGLDRVNVFSPEGSAQLLSHAFFVHNFSRETFFGINPSFWSLATEMQFYLLFPLLLWLRERLGIAKCLGLLLLVGLVWRAIAVWRWGFPDHPITPALVSPLATWFDWTLGAFVAERFFHGQPAFPRQRAWFPGLLALFVISTLYKPLLIFSFSLASAAGAVGLDMALQTSWRKNSATVGFAFFGLISYSLYLWHQPLLIRVSYHLPAFRDSAVLAWLVSVPLIVAGSWLSYVLVEKTGLRWGKTLWTVFDKKSAAANDGLTY